MKVLVIHGPNLNLLGDRETDIYGQTSLEEIDQALKDRAKSDGIDIECFQSNHEGDIVEKIQSGKDEVDGLLINPAAFTHYSIALRDAISAVELPVVEVHLSNIYSREDWRSKSVIAPIATGQISGFGMNSYLLGFVALTDFIKKDNA